MKIKTAVLQLGLFLAILCCSEGAFASGTPVGDIMLTGRVERAGQRLVNDTTLFEGDTIRTLDNSGSIVRIGRGRLEIDQQSEVEIVSEKPLKIVVKGGGVRFNFPVGTDFEIVTPQLDVHPSLGAASYSGEITTQPKKEDRVISRSGRYSILEREAGGDTNTIHEGQILIASLVLPALPQGAAGGATIATIVQFDPPAATQVNVAHAANPNNFSTRGTVGMALASGDVLRDLQGNARIEFSNDKSVITLRPGTDVTIKEEVQPAGLLRSISQAAGTLWFSITKATGTQTKLSTPTAVAAIRGTEGQQTVDEALAGSTTYALTEGIEEIQENLTGSRVTIRGGQTVIAIRGVGFTVVSALVAAIGPSVGGAGPGGPGGGAGGGAGGAGGAGGGAAAAGAGAGAGAAAATTTTAAVTAASTITTVASVAVTTAVPAAAAAIVPQASNGPAGTSESPPFSFPGALTILETAYVEAKASESSPSSFPGAL